MLQTFFFQKTINKSIFWVVEISIIGQFWTPAASLCPGGRTEEASSMVKSLRKVYFSHPSGKFLLAPPPPLRKSWVRPWLWRTAAVWYLRWRKAGPEPFGACSPPLLLRSLSLFTPRHAAPLRSGRALAAAACLFYWYTVPQRCRVKGFAYPVRHHRNPGQRQREKDEATKNGSVTVMDLQSYRTVRFIWWNALKQRTCPLRAC